MRIVACEICGADCAVPDEPTYFGPWCLDCYEASLTATVPRKEVP